MHKEDIKAALLRSLSGFLTVSMAVGLYFLLQNLPGIVGWLRMVTNILNPFLIGFVFAYLLKNPVNFLTDQFNKKIESKKGRRAVNFMVVLAVIILLVFLVYMLFRIVLPEMIRSVNRLLTLLPSAMKRFVTWSQSMFSDNPELQMNVNKIVTSLEDTVKKWMSGGVLPQLQEAVGRFASVFGSAVGMIYDVIIGLIVCVYLLLDRKRFSRHAKLLLYGLFPNRAAERIDRELIHVDQVFVGFFGGKLLDSAIIGGICYLFCFVMNLVRGFQNGVLVSVLVGLFNLIPYFGPIIGGAVSALLILIDDPLNCLIFVIFILILQQVDGNILGPRILSDSVGLPGIWVLFSITLFGGLFGFIGIVTGVPVFAVIYDAVRRLTMRGIRRHNRTDLLKQPDADPGDPWGSGQPLQGGEPAGPASEQKKTGKGFQKDSAGNSGKKTLFKRKTKK